MRRIILLTLIITLISCIRSSEETYPLSNPNKDINPSSDNTEKRLAPSKLPMPNTEGVRTGSGGDGIACYDKRGKLNKVYLWDYVEAYAYGINDNQLGFSNKTERENLDIYFDRIFKSFKNSYFEEAFYRVKYLVLEALLEKDNIQKYGKENRGPFQVFKFINKDNSALSLELSDIKDDASILKINQNNCRRVQLARTEKKINAYQNVVTIDYNFYQYMPNHHRVGLLIHETLLLLYNASLLDSDKNGESLALYKSEKLEESTNSIRMFLRLIATDQISKLSYTELINRMKEYGLLQELNSSNPSFHLLKDQDNFNSIYSSFLVDGLDVHYSSFETQNYTFFTDIYFPLIYKQPFVVPYFDNFFTGKNTGYIKEIDKLSIYSNLDSDKDLIFSISENHKVTLKSGIDIEILSSQFRQVGKIQEQYADEILWNLNFPFLEIINKCGQIIVSKESSSIKIGCIAKEVTYLTKNIGEATFIKGSNLTVEINDKGLTYISNGIIKGTYIYDPENQTINKLNSSGCTEVYLKDNGIVYDTSNFEDRDLETNTCPRIMKKNDFFHRQYEDL